MVHGDRRSRRKTKRSVSPPDAPPPKRRAAGISTPSTDKDGASPAVATPEPPQKAVDKGVPVFKNPNYKSSTQVQGKKRTWKGLKQIIAAERSLPWKPDDPTYSSIDAPPSLKPCKKYSDLSGFPAKYTDPFTGLRYCSPTEFAQLRQLPSDIVQGYLSLRRANPAT